MVGLTGQVGGDVIVNAVFLKRRVAQIGPQYGDQPQLMRALESGWDLLNLAARLFWTKIDSRPHGHRAEVEGLLNAGIQRLIESIWVAQRFVVVELHEERNAVRVATRNRRQHAVGGGHAVTARFNSQFDDVFRVKIERVGGKRGPGRVLNALIDRQNRQVARAG